MNDEYINIYICSKILMVTIFTYETCIITPHLRMLIIFLSLISKLRWISFTISMIYSKSTCEMLLNVVFFFLLNIVIIMYWIKGMWCKGIVIIALNF